MNGMLDKEQRDVSYIFLPGYLKLMYRPVGCGYRRFMLKKDASEIDRMLDEST